MPMSRLRLALALMIVVATPVLAGTYSYVAIENGIGTPNYCLNGAEAEFFVGEGLFSHCFHAYYNRRFCVNNLNCEQSGGCWVYTNASFGDYFNGHDAQGVDPVFHDYASCY